MGNNTSQVRKSLITYNESNVRKSSTSQNTNQSQNLDEEFSDLILHEVKKDQDPGSLRRNLLNSRASGVEDSSFGDSDQYNQFLNDLIEDEFNELNDLIETDETELSRNILPNDKNDDESMNDDTLQDSMDVDESSDSPAPDLSDVDFTKIVTAEPPPHPIPSSDFAPNRSPHPSNNKRVRSLTQFQNQPEPKQHQQQRNPYQHATVSQVSVSSNDDTKVPVEIKWVNILKENIQKVSIIGSFSNWRNIIRLKPSPIHPNEYVVTIKLPLGVHKLLYIINNEYRVSEQLPTATDQEGIFFNWFEVLDELHLFNHSQNQPDRTNASTKYDANIIQAAGQAEIGEIQRKSNSFLTKISKEEPNFEHVEFMDDSDDMKQEASQDITPLQEFIHERNGPYISLSDNNSSSFLLSQSQQSQIAYSSEIPEVFINYSYFKSQNENFELPEPPQLPAHLNNVLLNKMSNSNNSGSFHGITNGHSHGPTHHNGSSSSTVLPVIDPLKPPNPPFIDQGGNKRPPLRRADSSYYASNQEAYHLSIPNHVILNHLMTTSIRNDVLTVACITRYSGKFVTQIMHSPADTSTA